MARTRTGKNAKNISAKTLIKIGAVLFVCIYITCTFVKQQITLSKCDNIAEEYEERIAEAELQQEKLQNELEKAGTDEYIQRAAREKLGLVKANERVFIDISQE